MRRRLRYAGTSPVMLFGLGIPPRVEPGTEVVVRSKALADRLTAVGFEPVEKEEPCHTETS